MSNAFGHGALAEGAGASTPDTTTRAVPSRPARARVAPDHRPPRSATAWFAFVCVRVVVVTIVAFAFLVILAYMKKLPDGLQNSVADSAEGIGLDVPRADEELFDRLQGPGGPVTPGTMPSVSIPPIELPDVYGVPQESEPGGIVSPGIAPPAP